MPGAVPSRANEDPIPDISDSCSAQRPPAWSCLSRTRWPVRLPPNLNRRENGKLCRGSDQLSLWLWSRCRTRESGTWLRNRSGAESRQSDLVAGTGSAPGRKVTDGNRPCAMTIT